MVFVGIISFPERTVPPQRDRSAAGAAVPRDAREGADCVPLSVVGQEVAGIPGRSTVSCALQETPPFALHLDDDRSPPHGASLLAERYATKSRVESCVRIIPGTSDEHGCLGRPHAMPHGVGGSLHASDEQARQQTWTTRESRLACRVAGIRPGRVRLRLNGDESRCATMPMTRSTRGRGMCWRETARAAHQMTGGAF